MIQQNLVIFRLRRANGSRYQNRLFIESSFRAAIFNIFKLQFHIYLLLEMTEKFAVLQT